jgi:hypothetical protein
MKKYYGNYLGICISNSDPQYRGRVQIFIPNIMPALYKKWNQDGKDITINGVGDNLQGGIPSEVIEDLKKILPWAEAASPIMGGSAPGTLTTNAKTAPASSGIVSTLVKAVANVIAPGASTLVNGVKNFYDQSPTATPPNSLNPGDQTKPAETSSVSGTVASASPHQSTVPVGTNPGDPSYGSSANPAVAPVNAPNTGNNTISPGLAAGFAVIGQGETGFQTGEANTDRYNQVNNNANVRAGVNKGLTAEQSMASFGDYGFYQCNDHTEGALVEKYCLSQGFSQDQATYYRQAITNNAGKGSFSVSDQTQAMSYLFAQQHPAAVQQLNALKPEDPNFQQSVNQIMLQFKGQWFGIPRGIQENAASPNSSANQIIKNGKAISSPNVVNTPDRHGPTATLDVNNTPKGMFSFPSPGALLWVFFQEGNPLFPVYFAANYGAGEWQSAYKTSSPGQGISTTPNADGATSHGGVWTTESGGGMHWVNDEHPTDPTQSNKSLMIFSHDGSNMHFNTGYHQIYSKFDRRDQVEKDRFESTGGNHETLVQGDHNHVVMGDMIVKVGNVSQPAVDAVTRIQQLLTEIHAPLTKSS